MGSAELVLGVIAYGIISVFIQNSVGAETIITPLDQLSMLLSSR